MSANRQADASDAENLTLGVFPAFLPLLFELAPFAADFLPLHTFFRPQKIFIF
jgi:hypothetical protein